MVQWYTFVLTKVITDLLILINIPSLMQIAFCFFLGKFKFCFYWELSLISKHHSNILLVRIHITYYTVTEIYLLIFLEFVQTTMMKRETLKNSNLADNF